MSEVYKEYAQSVIDGKIIAGRYIKLACKRFLDWFDRDDMYFDTDAADRVVKFCEKLTLFSGKTSGQKFKLEPCQKWICYNLFGFKWKDTGYRVITKAFIEVARKFGKSTFASALCLYALLCDGEDGAQVLNVANNREQGKLLFDIESKFAEGIDRKGKHLKILRDRIKFPKKASYSRCLSSDSSGLDGLSASFFICDETHEYKDSALWDVLMSSQGFRTQPMAIQITTAGFNQFGFCYKYRQMCIDILNGTIEDDTQFAALYELDDGDDWQDESVWIKANPLLDITIERKYLRDQCRMAMNNSSLEVGFRTKNLNQWVQSSSVWLTNQLLEQYSKKLDLKVFSGLYGYGGVDLASVSDLTAFSLMIPYDEKYYFKTWYYLPQSALHDNANAELYKQWRRDGFLTVTDGNVTDYDYVLNDILRVNKDVLFTEIAYDAYNATQFTINAQSVGMPMKAYSQALWSFNRPSREFERLLKMGKIIIDDNPITRWCFANCAIKTDHNDNAKPVKGGDDMKKIDGVIAMLEALGSHLGTPIFDNDISV